MKTFLLALVASMTLGAAAFAADEIPAQDELRSDDELALILGADQDEAASLDSEALADNLVPPPPFRPAPRPPIRPVPRPPFHPAPRPPVHPVPPPFNPTHWVCASQAAPAWGQPGRVYTARGYDRYQTQAEAHRECTWNSGRPCRDLGCRVR